MRIVDEEFVKYYNMTEEEVEKEGTHIKLSDAVIMWIVEMRQLNVWEEKFQNLFAAVDEMTSLLMQGALNALNKKIDTEYKIGHFEEVVKVIDVAWKLIGDKIGSTGVADDFRLHEIRAKLKEASNG